MIATERAQRPRPEATRPRQNSLTILALAGSLGIGIACSMALFPVQVAVVLVLAMLVALMALVDIWSTVILLIVARSSLDVFADRAVFGGFNVAGVLAAALIVLGVAHLVLNRVKVSELPLTQPFLALLAVLAFGLSYSQDTLAAVQDWVRMLGSFMLYVLMVSVLTNDTRRASLIRALLLSAIIPLVVGVYQLATGSGDDYTQGFIRIQGTFVHPSPYAFYLLTVLPFAAALAGHARPGWSRLGLILMAGTAAASVLFTFTRIAWLGLVLTLLVLTRAKRWMLLAVLGGVVLVYVFAPAVQDRLSDATSESGSGTWRLEQWQAVLALPSVAQYPTGLGLGAVESLTGIETHNDYLKMLVEGGILGFAALLWLYISLFKHTIAATRLAESRFHQAIATAFLAVLVARAAMCVSDNIIGIPVVEWYFWSLAGLTVALVPRPNDRPTRAPALAGHPGSRP
ncbi:MAG TPA: O-antigen ligase family protein [Dehalococcoidia bacterium]|nr:O-antigen ligase family protein [Dehalococcoidia bacterium]